MTPKASTSRVKMPATLTNGMDATMPASARPENSFWPAQPLATTLVMLQPGATMPMKSSSSKMASKQLEGGGDADACPVPRDEHDAGAERDHLRIDAGELHVQVGADGQRDRRRREHEFDQRGEAGDEASK
jgi:hypothetical protein